MTPEPPFFLGGGLLW